MTDTPSQPRDGGSDPEEGDDEGDRTPSTEAVYEAMEPLEPYTTGEIASVLGVSKRVVRGLLNRLAEQESIRKKEPEPKRLIWIREPPKHECPNCGGEFEVKYFHPVFQAVQFCPKCGTRLRKRERG